MLKKTYCIVLQVFIAYIIAFFTVGIPLVSYAGSLYENGATVYERNGNPDLLYSILNGSTRLAKNVTADSTTTFVSLDSPMHLIAKYSPMLQEGRIALFWVHNFLIPQNYTKWINEMKKEGKWGRTWFAEKAYDIDGKWRAKAVVFHILTPQEAFKPIVAANGKVLFDGKLLKNLGSVNYRKIEYCSANNLSSSYCSDMDYKAGETTFFDIVSAIARRYNVADGFVVVQKTSTHHVVEKHHHAFKTKITVKYYIDSYPQYYMLVPPWTPGVNTPTSGFLANGMGYLKVDPNTAEGWDFSKGSVEFYEQSKSGWNGWVGIALGGLGMLGGFVLGPALLGNSLLFSGLGLSGSLYTAYATVEVAHNGNWGTFHGLFQYNKLSLSLNNSMYRRAARADSLRWMNASFGHEFDGSRTVLNIQNNLNQLKYAGLKIFKTLDSEQRHKIQELQEQQPSDY